MVKINYRRLAEDVVPPVRATPNSAGLDFFATETIKLLANNRYLIPTGIALEIPEGYFGLARPRGGHAVKGLRLNHSGIIDSDFRGEIKFGMMFLTSDHYAWLTINKGERFAQLVIVPYLQVELVETQELSSTVRGTGELNSTGLGKLV